MSGSVWTIPFDDIGNGASILQLSRDIDAPCIVSIECDAGFYPLEKHFRYARHEGGNGPYTFSHFGFCSSPPGILVGPWPGWRDIEQMPRVSISFAEKQIPGQYQFYGDELVTRVLNLTFRVSEMCDLKPVLHISDHRIRPAKCTIRRVPDNCSIPIAVSLIEEMQGMHPRLFITPTTIDIFRNRALTSHRELHNRIVELLDNWELPPDKTPESKLPAGPERLFAEDRVVLSALQTLLFPSEQHLERAIDALLDYVTLTQRDDYEPLRIDTQSGEVLFTLCIGYDWLHRDLNDHQRSIVESRLNEVAQVCLNHLPETRTDYAQAHFLGCGLGLLAYAFLLWEDDAMAPNLAARMRGALERVINLLPDDGFFPHGINLWSYEHGFLFRWLELFRCCTGENLWEGFRYWKNASRFSASVTSSDWTTAITLGDPQYRVGGDSWCHDLIAARTKSRQAQSLANALRDLPVDGVDYRNAPARRRVWEFLFHDPVIESLEKNNGIQVFHDGGQVNARHGKRLVVFRSGAPLGKSRRDGGELGAYGHSDPGNGGLLVHDGEDFILSGPGPSYWRSTSLHNIVTINGRGQIGDSCVWLPDVFPESAIPDAPIIHESDECVSVFAELTRAYLPSLGVKSYVRALFIAPEIIIGVDSISLNIQSDIALNFHSWGSFIRNSDGVWRINGKSENYELHFFSRTAFNVECGLTEFVPAYPHSGNRDSFLRMTVFADEERMCWFLGSAPISPPTIVHRDDHILLTCGKRHVMFSSAGLMEC